MAFAGLSISLGGILTADISMKLDRILGKLEPNESRANSIRRTAMILGIIILDEKSVLESDFPDFSMEQLIEMDLTHNEASSYINNREELSSVFNSAMNDSSIDEAKKTWDEAKIILGTDALKGLEKVFAFQSQ